MRIVYLAHNVRGVRCLERLVAERFEIAAVVVHHDAPDGPPETSVRHCAKRHGLPLLDPRDVNAPASVARLAACAPDLMVMSGYTQILRPALLSLPPLGVINLHGGKLPRYRGAAPINWQILNGETRAACTILYADEGIDTGDVIAEREYEIAPEDDATSVLEKTLRIFPDLLAGVLRALEAGTAPRTPQDRSAGAYHTKRYPRDGRIAWDRMTAEQIHNLCRSLTPPYPGAFTFLEGRRVVIWKTRLLAETVVGPPGRIALKRPDGVVVAARDRGLLVETIQPEGEPGPVPAAPRLKIRGDTLE